MIDFKELVETAKKNGQRLLVIDLGSKPKFAMTEARKDLAWALGTGMAVAVRFLYTTNKGQYTKQQIIDALLSSATSTMRQQLKDLPDEEADSDVPKDDGLFS